MIGEAGVRISGGQRQRIGIARALYRRPEILVLDEATSALDNDTEAAVMEAIDSLQGKMTMLIIAHRLATVKNCDVIIVLDKGEIVEQGTHEELLEKQGEYYRLWEMQQGNIVVKNDSVEKEAEVDIVEEDSDEVISYS